MKRYIRSSRYSGESSAEMLNDYVLNHLLGENCQDDFINSFIDSLGLDLDGRLVGLRSGDYYTRVRADLDGITGFVVGQIMSKSHAGYVPFTEPFEVVEVSQPAIRFAMAPDGTITSMHGRLSDALEGGRRNASRYDDM